MRRLADCLVAAVVALAVPSYVAADSILVFETEDWHFEAPDALGTQAELELSGAAVRSSSVHGRDQAADPLSTADPGPLHLALADRRRSGELRVADRRRDALPERRLPAR